jgi:hypothetical protein
MGKRGCDACSRRNPKIQLLIYTRFFTGKFCGNCAEAAIKKFSGVAIAVEFLRPTRTEKARVNRSKHEEIQQ